MESKAGLKKSEINIGTALIVFLLYCFFTALPFLLTIFFSLSFDSAITLMLICQTGLALFTFRCFHRAVPGLRFSSGDVKLNLLVLSVFSVTSLIISTLLSLNSDMTLIKNSSLNVTVIAVVLVIAPFYEEIFFRGMILGCLTTLTNHSIFFSCILATVPFCLLHFQDYTLFGMLDIFFSGLSLCYIRLATGSLLYPFILHAIMNGYSIL